LAPLWDPWCKHGIRGVNTIHIGKYLAFVRLQGRSHGYCRGIRATTSQRCNAAAFIDALKTGYHHYTTCIQVCLDQGSIDVPDPGFAVSTVGTNAYLPAGERACLHTQFMQCHGKQGNSHLLTGGQQHVHFPCAGMAVQFTCQCKQTVGFTRHGGYHHHNLIAFIVIGFDSFRDGLNALGSTHRGATVFLDNKRHDLLITDLDWLILTNANYTMIWSD